MKDLTEEPRMPALTSLIPPPSNTVEGGPDLEWPKIEKKLKTPLPADYKSFIETYGTGTFAEFYFVFNPFSKTATRNLLEMAKNLRGQYTEQHKEDPNEYPYPSFPAKGGLLPWG